MTQQANFVAALLDPERACPSDLYSGDGAPVQARFAIYRNNLMVSLIDALADTFPVAQALVGETFFRAMAREFVRAHLPTSRVMAYYGIEFSAFVETFPPAASLPYLADICRLEMSRVLAYHAEDADAINPAALDSVLASPSLLANLQIRLHASVHCIQSRYSVASIWAQHQADAVTAWVNPGQPECVMVFRSLLTVHTQPLPVGTAQFLIALQKQQRLLEAANAAAQADPSFDLVQVLAFLLHHQLIIDIETKAPHECSI